MKALSLCREPIWPVSRSATSFGYVIGGGFRPSPVVEAMLEWEHDMNRLVGQRFRILALVNLLVTK